MPTEANLLERYDSFSELEQACSLFCEQINTRPHRVTGRPPAELLIEEHGRLHVLPPQPVTVAFGQTRLVCWDSTIDERVWARWARGRTDRALRNEAW